MSGRRPLLPKDGCGLDKSSPYKNKNKAGFIRPEGLVDAGGLDKSSPYKCRT